MICKRHTSEVYAIELIQGDYASFAFEIVDNENAPIANIEKVMFVCAKQKVQKKLTQIEPTKFFLELFSTQTQELSAKTSTYDIVISFTTNETPVTVVYGARFTVLPKENVV